MEKLKPVFARRQYEARRDRHRAIAAVKPAARPPAPLGHKWCPHCRQNLPHGEFGTRGKGKLAVHCRPCQSAYYHENMLKKLYGITVDEYERLLAIQDGRCAICERRPRARRLAVDHDHETGEVRGLLCTRCNHKLIGAAYESAAILRRAARYIDKPPARSGKPVPARESDLFELRLEDEMDRAEAARVTDGADVAAVWFKRRGRTSPGAGFVLLSGDALLKLLTAAGYIAATHPTLSATVPVENAPPVPEDTPRRTGCARCDTDEMPLVCHCRRECSSDICSAMDQTPAPAGFHEPDEPTDHIVAAFDAGTHGRTAPPRGQTRRLDVGVGSPGRGNNPPLDDLDAPGIRAAVAKDFCTCESYDCHGECCGIGNCTCTPAADGQDGDGRDG